MKTSWPPLALPDSVFCLIPCFCTLKHWSLVICSAIGPLSIYLSHPTVLPSALPSLRPSSSHLPAFPSSLQIAGMSIHLSPSSLVLLDSETPSAPIHWPDLPSILGSSCGTSRVTVPLPFSLGSPVPGAGRPAFVGLGQGRGRPGRGAGRGGAGAGRLVSSRVRASARPRPGRRRTWRCPRPPRPPRPASLWAWRCRRCGQNRVVSHCTRPGPSGWTGEGRAPPLCLGRVLAPRAPLPGGHRAGAARVLRVPR